MGTNCRTFDFPSIDTGRQQSMWQMIARVPRAGGCCDWDCSCNALKIVGSVLWAILCLQNGLPLYTDNIFPKADAVRMDIWDEAFMSGFSLPSSVKDINSIDSLSDENLAMSVQVSSTKNEAIESPRRA